MIVLPVGTVSNRIVPPAEDALRRATARGIGPAVLALRGHHYQRYGAMTRHRVALAHHGRRRPQLAWGE
jgi:hypothetical protein